MNPKNIKRKRFKKLFLLLAFLISLITLFYYSFVFEPNNIQIEKINIEIKNLPEEFEGTKIVHLTDFHSRNFGKREERVLKILKDLDPDFVFITGDFIDHSTKDLDSCQKFWRKLSNQHQGKVFGVLGNHEHWLKSPDISAIKRMLERNGISILNNENRKIYLGGRDEALPRLYIYLIGVDDPDSELDDLPKAMIDTEENIPKILLAHSPDIIDNLQGKKVDLILVGHTHGGQIVLPFVKPFWVPTKNRGKYASGLFEVNDTYLYVNRGIGLAPTLPARFNCPPEITVIELK
ncbi:MAG: metallophosphoesterase [Candidatus Pacebacteria bacterium]|nr:metallophosphoesterase [Candidatus Paceibacterota bacterium]